MLVPPGLRDLLLSGAYAGVFRAVWQDEILAEMYRNGVKLRLKRGDSLLEAQSALGRVVREMAVAFPDGCLASMLWVPLVGAQTNHPKDRHVMAAAQGSGATHLVTSNVKHFPLRSRPSGVKVARPDAFMLGRLAADPDGVLGCVEQLASRHSRPAQTARDLARQMQSGQFVPRFGHALEGLLR